MTDVADRKAGWGRAFRDSRWFTRVWTLQELIAPPLVEFFASDWTAIGTKLERLDEINAVTGIWHSVLECVNPRERNVAERLSWAAHRKASREEDAAYSLLGLFDINMPMLYGEGI